MAANPPLDINNLTNWEHAFEQCSIPQVRTLHRQLQNNLSVNREKLRALVGQSYRDLLQTAEKIIEMDRQVQQVESNLSNASRNCNWRLLERKARNVQMFHERVMGKDREKFVLAAQLAVLQGCPKELSKILHRGGSCILAARIFVIYRLLLKSLQTNGTIPLVLSLRDQFTSLRAILLRHIDQQLRLASTPTFPLIESMCALTLVKTSSPADLLRHFLNMRSNAISSTLDITTLDTTAVLDALRLFDKTVRDTEAIFPKKISEALFQLKSKPLFENEELRDIPGLNLKTNERWLPEDIRGFIPWVRHDELEKSKVNDPVKAWAVKELELLNENLKLALEKVDSISKVVGLRKEILELWGGNHSLLLNAVIGSEGPRREFRVLINKRLVELLNMKASTLKEVGVKIGKLVKGLDEKDKDTTSLWSDTLRNMRTSNGASLFRKTIKSAIQGYDKPIRTVHHDYSKWTESIIKSFQLIKSISKVEKRDEFADDDDEFGLGLDSVQDGIEDSEMLQKEFQESLKKFFTELEAELERHVGACEVDLKNHLEATTIRCVFLLRTIRLICSHPPHLPDDSTTPIIPLSWFSKSLIPRLQYLISTGASTHAINFLRKSMQRRKWEKEAPSRPLWEGSPVPLPVQPSPDVLKFLHELVSRMAGTGNDVWTKGSVGCLKELVREEVGRIMGQETEGRVVKRAKMKSEKEVGENSGKSLEDKAQEGDEGNMKRENQEDVTQAIGTTEVNNPSLPSNNELESTTNTSTEISNSWAIQLIYDIAYLKRAFYSDPTNSTTSESAEALTTVQQRFKSILAPAPGGSASPSPAAAEEEGRNVQKEDNEETENEQVYKGIEDGAGEYWKRTYLLFSLLG